MNQLIQNPIFFIGLIISGILFGMGFTWTHFLALKRYCFNQSYFKRALLVLLLFRLCIFALVLWVVLDIHKNPCDVLVFFAAFMLGRKVIFEKTKRMLKNGKDI